MGGQSSKQGQGNSALGYLTPPDAEWEKDAHIVAQETNNNESLYSPDDLVFETWATCRGKPELKPLYGKAEQDRQKSLAWRGRKDWMALNCGDDSFFVSADKTILGIADGVGGWRSKGVDPSLFANAFMGNSKQYADTHRKERDAQVVMQEGYGKLLRDDIVKMGSSTACGVSLFKSKDGQHFLDLVNLGDSGALVVRDGFGLVFKTEEVTHRFNFPYQLSVMPGMNVKKMDSLNSSSHGLVKVERGDLVIMGTDGLFDNRHDLDLMKAFKKLAMPNPTPAGSFFGLNLGSAPALPMPAMSHSAAQKLVEEQLEVAYNSALSKHESTPWAVAYTKATGRPCSGGKPDDITIMVARVMKRGELESSSSPGGAQTQ